MENLTGQALNRAIGEKVGWRVEYNARTHTAGLWHGTQYIGGYHLPHLSERTEEEVLDLTWLMASQFDQDLNATAAVCAERRWGLHLSIRRKPDGDVYRAVIMPTTGVIYAHEGESWSLCAAQALYDALGGEK